MRKILMLFLGLFISMTTVLADEIADVKMFFNKYVSAANTYSDSLASFYAPDAKILRYVIQKDGSLYPYPLKASFAEYKQELSRNAKIAKLRNYKNYYSDINITKNGDNFKLKAMRKPSTSDYKIPAEFIIGKNSAGNYVIKEEIMQTKVQMFIKEIEKQQRS